MQWNSAAITPGEIEALKLAAEQAWADDTRYPRWKGSSHGGGQCYVTAAWLTSRLGGKIGKKEGHYVWLSPDESYILDLTGGHKVGSATYEPNSGYVKLDLVQNNRVNTFIKRANLIFNNLDAALKVAADSLTGDAFPGEEPERKTLNDQQYWHDEPHHDDVNDINEEYNFFYANGELEISPADTFNHEDLARHLKIDQDHQGPMASGTVTVNKNVATWKVASNINLKALERVFRAYTDQVGWDWGGTNDVGGKVISRTVKKPIKYNYIWANQHLYIGETSHAVLALKAEAKPLCGTIEVVGNKARVTPAYTEALSQLFEWANDKGIKLYGSSNNLIQRNETMEQEDLGRGADDGELTNPVEQNGEDDTPIDSETELGVHKCPICEEIFPDWHLYEEHRRDEHGDIDNAELEEHGKFPELDMDQTNPPHFTEQQPLTMPIASVREATRVDGFVMPDSHKSDQYYVAYASGSPVGFAVVRNNEELYKIHTATDHQVIDSLFNKIEMHYAKLASYKSDDKDFEYHKSRGWINASKDKWIKHAEKEPKDTLTDPIPFIYDIPADTITVGHPGQRTSDIPGKFTPAGIVEGMYEPGGTVNITTMTTMPYTVNHILTLWYYQYPEFSVKRVNLIDAEGKKTKLANEAAL